MDDEKAIKVLLADDHQVIRQALRRILLPEKDVEVIGEASDGAEAVKKTLELHPDVVLLDLRMPKMDGLEALARIKEEVPRTEVIVLSIFNDEAAVREAFNLGASGYALKDARQRDLVGVIRRVRSGQVYAHPSSRHFILGQLRQADARRLTRQEKHVLGLVADGFSDEDISQELKIEPSRVSRVLGAVFSKLEYDERVQEVAARLRSYQQIHSD